MERRGGEEEEEDEGGNWALLSFPPCYCASSRGSDDVDGSETPTMNDVVDGKESGPV